ncbi:MAG: TatD family hydrolase [Paracoccaceae bacterium]
MKIIDSHCHLDFDKFDSDLDEVINRAKNTGISKILTICTQKEKLAKTLSICENNEFIFFAYGLHPLNVGKEKIETKEILKISGHNKMIAIGESGLDYYYSKDTIKLQKKSFIEHIKISQKTKLPLVIHSRDADEDMRTILSEEYEKNPFIAVMHCFSAGKSLANTAIELGFYLSMSGIVTFPKSNDLCDIFSRVPIEQVLVETDSPYLSPVPFRGKRNEPSYIVNTVKKGAEIFSISPNSFSEITSKNFNRLFKKASV